MNDQMSMFYNHPTSIMHGNSYGINYETYLDRYGRRKYYITPSYPNQPIYHPSFYPQDQYNNNNKHLNQAITFNNKYAAYFNEVSKRYWQAQYLQHLAHFQRLRNYDKAAQTQFNTLAKSSRHKTDYAYEFHQEIRYIPYPIYIQPSRSSRRYVPNYTENIFMNNGAYSLANQFQSALASTMKPKIRVIAIPGLQSVMQQPCLGPLSMPPFLYNRISQPFSSFLLPPPLPQQISSSPYAGAAQQILLQRYQNPIATVPFPTNWNSFSPMMTPSVVYCCTLNQSTDNRWILPSSVASNSIAPTSNISQFSIIPSMMGAIPAQNPMLHQPISTLVNPPASAPQSLTYASAIPDIDLRNSTKSSEHHPSISTGSFQPIITDSKSLTSFDSPLTQQEPISSQSYGQRSTEVVPSTVTSLSVTMPSSVGWPVAPAQSLTNTNQPSLTYEKNISGSVCRACPPAPPGLSIPVSGYFWMQHCSACRNIHNSAVYPNVRPATGRSTPILREPLFSQYYPEQAKRNAYQLSVQTLPPAMASWLRKTPPLPPGAVLISDKYLKSKNSRISYALMKRSPKNPSIIVITRPIPSRLTLSKNFNNNQREKLKFVLSDTDGKLASKSTWNYLTFPVEDNKADSKSLSTTSVDGSNGTEKSDIIEKYIDSETSITPKHSENMADEARNVDIKRLYQAPEMSSVYRTNLYVKSDTDVSTVSTHDFQSPNLTVTPYEDAKSVSSSSSDDSLSSTDTFSVQNEEVPSASRASQASPKKLIIVRKIRSYSPSTISRSSTILSDDSFRIVKSDSESVSRKDKDKCSSINV